MHKKLEIIYVILILSYLSPKDALNENFFDLELGLCKECLLKVQEHE